MKMANLSVTDTSPKEVKYIDLFCGLGAFHTAFNRNNIIQNNIKYTCVLASDINEGVRNIYEENYGIKPMSLKERETHINTLLNPPIKKKCCETKPTAGKGACWKETRRL